MSASRSPTRPILLNTTNVESANQSLPKGIVTPPSDAKRPPERNWVLGSTKRVKIEEKFRTDEDSDDSNSDVEVEVTRVSRPRRTNMAAIRNAWMAAGPSSLAHLPAPPMRPVLRSFVSSNKADVYACHSMSGDAYLTPPYACAYTHGAKKGKNALLAVSTEQGTVHILNTAKRQEWDVEPQRKSLRLHHNGIFDVKWSPSDTLLATGSADKTVQVVDLESSSNSKSVCSLARHTSTVKCVAWDPTRGDNIIATGCREGMICVWDLRVRSGAGGRADGQSSEAQGRQIAPVIVVPHAHETEKIARKSRSRTKLATPPSRGVTSVVFPAHDQNALISSGSYDGILRLWDLRYINPQPPKRTRSSTLGCAPKVSETLTTPLNISSADPTTYLHTRRPRGITSLTAAPSTSAFPTASAGLLFALSTDSRIHTYDARTLAPLSGWSDSPSDAAGETNAPWTFGHPDLHVRSFYVRMSASPCGRWLACGGSQGGSVFLFDVAAGKMGGKACRGVQLTGQKGEVGAVDWAAPEVGLATCADDGTVRVWREDLDRYRQCREEPEEMKWSWCWSVRED